MKCQNNIQADNRKGSIVSYDFTLYINYISVNSGFELVKRTCIMRSNTYL